MTYNIPPLGLEPLSSSAAIRAAFEQKFLIPWERFRVERKDWLDYMASKNYQFRYEEALLWDRMPRYPEVSFAHALNLLRTMDCPVLLMSESPLYRGSCEIRLGERECKGVVFRADACSLACRIEFEWYENRRLAEQGMYLDPTILPEDLYVFDESMEHLLVFTHETNWVLEDPMQEADSRFCLAVGFPGESENR